MAGIARTVGTAPVLRLVAYYVALVALGIVLVLGIPGAREAFLAPIAADPVDIVPHLTGTVSDTGRPGPPSPWGGTEGRGALALVAALGAMALAFPVAWVYMLTRRLRYDASLVQAIIILPIVVAGVVLVVKNSLALAFALAGIVAGVRFRQKLNEPEEAVYVLLSLGIGLAAGVQALDVALAVSLVFNAAVLALWRFDVGRLVTSKDGPLLAVGDTRVLAGSSSENRRRVREESARQAGEMATDGILVVHASDPDLARRAVQLAIGKVADEWKFTTPEEGEAGLWRFEVMIKLNKKGDPLKLLTEIEERWGGHITAAEYIPFRTMEPER